MHLRIDQIQLLRRKFINNFIELIGYEVVIIES